MSVCGAGGGGDEEVDLETVRSCVCVRFILQVHHSCINLPYLRDRAVFFE